MIFPWKRYANGLPPFPPHSAVLYTIMIADAAGVPHEGRAALASIVEVSAAPVFSLYGSELGQGVVGGPYHLEQREAALGGSAGFAGIERSNSHGSLDTTS